MSEIKEGDVVTLKSGSCNMTVSGIDANSKLVTCVWMNKIDLSIESKDFPEHCIKSVG